MKYIKVEDNTFNTPIVQYRKKGLAITCIGAIHLGNKEYYERLQKELDKFSFGFFEGIKPLTDEKNIPPEKRQYLDGMQKLGEVYRRFADYTGIVTQHGLKYPDTWKNPDMTLDEFITAASNKTLKKICGLGEGLDKLEKLHESNPEELAAVINGVVRCFYSFPILSAFVSFLTYGPLDQKVILKQRNQMLFDAIDLKLNYSGVDELGIIYGAGHLKGIDNYLRHKGFKREGELWIPAWNLESKISFLEAAETVVMDMPRKE
jgi:hypothetical protein